MSRVLSNSRHRKSNYRHSLDIGSQSLDISNSHTQKPIVTEVRGGISLCQEIDQSLDIGNPRTQKPILIEVRQLN